MKSQRDAFFDALFEEAKRNPDVYLVSADMGAPSLDKFRRELSRQYIDAGIAEQSALLLAAGLAKAGKRAFVYAIAPFITYRVIEQIRLDLCAMKLPVCLIGVGAGFGYDDSGPTHHTTEDIGMLRTLPNLTIYNPSDSLMAEELLADILKSDSPAYLRLDRKANSILEWNATAGEPESIIIATGNMVKTGMDIASELGLAFAEVSQFPVRLVPDDLTAYKRIITLEEHVLPGGLGSAVLELLSDAELLIPVKRFGIDYIKTDGYCYQYGGREEIQKVYGLDKESILREVKAWLPS